MTVTDGYDPFDDPTPREIYERGIIHQDHFTRPPVRYWGGGGGGAGGGGDGGGGGYSERIFLTSDNTNRLIPDLTQMVISPEMLKNLKDQLQTPEERQEMEWSSTDARDIAREILSEEKKEGLREKVTEAVAGYREMLTDAHCGSVFSFMKKNDKGEHYWYAAIKNGGKWYTTAQSPRVLEDDDALIEWLVLLQAYESEATELTAGAAHKALALGPVDTTAVET